MAEILNIVHQVYAYIIGAGLLPLFVALVNRQHWDPQIKQGVMLASAGVLAVLTYLAQSGWHVTSAADLTAAVIAVIGITQASYKLLWKQGGITDALERVTFGVAPPAPVEDPTGEPEDRYVPRRAAEPVAADESGARTDVPVVADAPAGPSPAPEPVAAPAPEPEPADAAPEPQEEATGEPGTEPDADETPKSLPSGPFFG